MFEVPDHPEPVGMLRGCWRALGRAFPGELGSWRQTHAAELAPGILRIVLDVPMREAGYLLLLDCLTAINVWTRRRWPFPSIYDGALRYEREPPGVEIWASTAALFARGYGDCEDLAADRVSELLLQGVPARNVLDLEQRTPSGDHYHVLLEHPGGLEDPSAALMR